MSSISARFTSNVHSGFAERIPKYFSNVKIHGECELLTEDLLVNSYGII